MHSSTRFVTSWTTEGSPSAPGARPDAQAAVTQNIMAKSPATTVVSSGSAYPDRHFTRIKRFPFVSLMLMRSCIEIPESGYVSRNLDSDRFDQILGVGGRPGVSVLIRHSSRYSVHLVMTHESCLPLESQRFSLAVSVTGHYRFHLRRQIHLLYCISTENGFGGLPPLAMTSVYPNGLLD